MADGSPVIPKREDPSRQPVEFTAAEQDRVSQLLERKLGKEELATRAGPRGSSLTYVESHKAIELANFVFGYNGWCSQVQNITVDFVDEGRDRCTVGLSVLMRITLKDGTFHEDLGYGSAQMPDKSAALEKAKKEAVSDARKRTLRLFGSALGNCVYDKQYVKDIRSGQAVSERIIPLNTPNRRSELVVKSEPLTPLPVPIFSALPQTLSSSTSTSTADITTTPRPPPYSPSPDHYDPNLHTATPGPSALSTPRTPKFPGRSSGRGGSSSNNKNSGCNNHSCSASKSGQGCGRGSSSSGGGSCNGSGGRGKGSSSCNNSSTGAGSYQTGNNINNRMGSNATTSSCSSVSGTSGSSCSSGSCSVNYGASNMNSGGCSGAGGSNSFRPQPSTSMGGGSAVRSSTGGYMGNSNGGCINGGATNFSGGNMGNVSSVTSPGNFVGISSTSGSMLSSSSCVINSNSFGGSSHNNLGMMNTGVINANSHNFPPSAFSGGPVSNVFNANNITDLEIDSAILEGLEQQAYGNCNSSTSGSVMNDNNGSSCNSSSCSGDGSGVNLNKENFDPGRTVANRQGTFVPNGNPSSGGWNGTSDGNKRAAPALDDPQGQKRGRT